MCLTSLTHVSTSKYIPLEMHKYYPYIILERLLEYLLPTNLPTMQQFITHTKPYVPVSNLGLVAAVISSSMI
jgi:hypothetical protein